MLLYALVVITAGLLLATAVALLRLHRERRDRHESARRFERWAAYDGPRRYRLPTFPHGHA